MSITGNKVKRAADKYQRLVNERRDELLNYDFTHNARITPMAIVLAILWFGLVLIIVLI